MVGLFLQPPAPEETGTFLIQRGEACSSVVLSGATATAQLGRHTGPHLRLPNRGLLGPLYFGVAGIDWIYIKIQSKSSQTFRGHSAQAQVTPRSLIKHSQTQSHSDIFNATLVPKLKLLL